MARSPSRLRISLTLLVAGVAGALPPPAAGLGPVLVFSRTTGFRHASIADGQAALLAIGDARGVAMTFTEDPAVFTPANLAATAAVVFLNTTGDVLDAPQQAAFEAWLRGGGGWIGVHAAANTEYDWPFYGELLGNGAWFSAHPAIQSARVRLERPGHPAHGPWPARFDLVEEWYGFHANPRPAVRVLMTLDEASYAPGAGAMGADHPIAWVHRVDAGRAFYTGFGHRAETYADPRFRAQLAGALDWVSGEIRHADGFE